MDSQTCLGGDRGWTPLIQQICVLIEVLKCFYISRSLIELWLLEVLLYELLSHLIVWPGSELYL